MYEQFSFNFFEQLQVDLYIAPLPKATKFVITLDLNNYRILNCQSMSYCTNNLIIPIYKKITKKKKMA